MMASLRAKSGGGRRSGNGRERRFVRQEGGSQDTKHHNNYSSNNTVGKRGHFAQAAAWQNTSVRFEKPSTQGPAVPSTSTSPETDPGTSDMFPFFKETRGTEVHSDHEGGDSQPLASRTGRRRRAGHPRRASAPNMDYLNPMYHTASADAQKAVASLYPGEDESPPLVAAMNGSNPMFTRNVSADGPSRVRLKGKKEGLQRANSASSGMSTKGSKDDGILDTKKSKESHLKKKKEQAMYEHVGRMDVRPFEDDSEDVDGPLSRGFRVDTFARNEGETGGKAHFKFVFTVQGDGSTSKSTRPVLDAVHERDEGNLRIRVNDGRQITATAGAAVEIALTNIGVVLFNPKTMAKGHHLYTLSLHGRTLFSVLA